jgi:hypothetical protein
MHRSLRHLIWAAACTAAAAGAHDAATTNVCGEGREQVVTHFKFTDKQLALYAGCIKDQNARCGNPTGNATASDGECRPQYCAELVLELPLNSLNGPVCTPTSCGVVDDAWGRAAHMAQDYCAGQPPVGSAQAKVTAPPSFLAPVTHHVDYTSNQGVVGDCVQCTVPSH